MMKEIMIALIMLTVPLAGCLHGTDTTDVIENAALGCTYADADNYDSNATGDDGSCTWSDEEDEPPAPVSTEGDVECDVFTVPTEGGDPVIGTHDSNGNVVLEVEPGIVTVIIDCIDVNGNTDLELTTSVRGDDIAGDPQFRWVYWTGPRIIEFGCWTPIYMITPTGTVYSPGVIWTVPCRDAYWYHFTGTSTPGGGSHGGGWDVRADHVTTTVTIDATPAPGRTHTSFVSNWTSGSDGAQGAFEISLVPVSNSVPVCYNRCISFWPGKVNQHNVNGTWMTDSDGVSGGHLSTEYATGYADRKLEYCQKFWPDTTSVLLRTFRETLSYYNAGNPEPPIPSNRDVYDCLVMEAVDTDGDGLSDWDELNIYNTNATNNDTDGDGVSDGDEVNNGTNPLDPNCRSSTGWVNESAAVENREAEPDNCWRDTEERDRYSVTIEREDENVRTIRTFNQFSMGHIQVSTTYHHLNVPFETAPPADPPICPPHSPDFVDDLTHANGHYGAEPSWSPSYYGPPTQNTPIIAANTFGTFGNPAVENNHVWVFSWDIDDNGWMWRCVGSSIGEQ